MFKAFVVVAAVAASMVAAEVSVKGFTADAKGDTDCKFGSGEILKKCATCAQKITECATSNPKETAKVCISDISAFAEDCGGCGVNILQCL